MHKTSHMSCHDYEDVMLDFK